MNMEQQVQKVRIDKWLWAARFFKTRNLSITAINGGKVHVDGLRPKPSREVRIDQQIKIRIGETERTVVVRALSTRRGPAKEAVLLYEEMPDSIAQREALIEERRQARLGATETTGRPTKKARRLIRQFKEGNLSAHSDEDSPKTS